MKKEVNLLNRIIFTISIVLLLMGVNISSFALESENIDIEAIKSEQEKYSPYEDKPYSDEYLEYLSLSDEEKAEVSEIPRKEFIAIHQSEEKLLLYSTMLSGIERASSLPSAYNLKDYVNINVEDQGSAGWCWAFSAMKTLETYISKNKSLDYNLAEYHLAYMRYKYFGGWNEITDEDNAGEEAYNSGGTYNDFMKYVGVYTSNYDLKGPIYGTNEENKIYEFTTENKNSFLSKQAVVKVTQAAKFSNISKEYSDDGSVTYKNGNTVLTATQIAEFRKAIKNQIRDNGAVWATAATPYSGRKYFNNSTNAEYYAGDSSQLISGAETHAITIVGWDDNYSKTNFNTDQQPKNDGAYICLNSWGENWGNGGYFYVSYDDALIELWMSGIVSAKLYSESPEISVSYSTKEPTNEDVKVTITCDERIEEISGWQISYTNTTKDTYSTIHTTQTTLTKTFSSNVGLFHPVYVKTVNGGVTYPQMISVANIDKTSPEGKVSYSITSPTNGNVTVVITANEELQEVEGWTLSEDKKVLTKEYKENKTETVTIKDLVGNETQVNIGINNIDKEAPQGKISYSTTSPTNKNVEVVITANEELQEVEGWTLSENKKVLTKAYTDNLEEKVIVKDLAGNESQAIIKVGNIDRTVPEGKISYSTTSPTNKNVEVVITANEELQEVEGWTLSEDELQLTKEYQENIKENVIVKDLAGNEAIANITITNIDKTLPDVNVTYSTTESTNESVTVVITANEELQEVEDWTLSEDKLQLTKVYNENIEETIIVKDLAGNESQAIIKVGNIDRTVPEGKISYSTTSPTNKNVEVVITANEELQEVEGWTLSEDELQLTKEYQENIKENVIVKDLAGNEAIANITITNIDKTLPDVNVTYSTTESTNESVTVVITANEELQEVEDWTLSEDKLQLTKVYNENIEETIIVKDLAGNEIQEKIIIKNIVNSNDETDDMNDDDKESGNTNNDNNETGNTNTDNYESNKANNNINKFENINTDTKTTNISKYENIDTTIANKAIPYTGYKIILNILIPIITISFLIVIVEYKKYNKEK